MVNKAYIIDHCPGYRGDCRFERRKGRAGGSEAKGVSMDANIVLRLLRKAGP